MCEPHAEAWLLDDEVAVRTVLELGTEIEIRNVRKVTSPKNELAGLHTKSPRAEDPIRTILTEIAQDVVPRRCQHARETGFEAFVDDVGGEIGPLTRTD